jgi:hypothetical protein
MKLLSAAALISCACVIAGCAGKTSAAGFSGPCSVLSRQEVSAAMREPVKAVQAGSDKCRYVADDQIDMITVEASETGAGTAFAGADLANHLMGVRAPTAGDGSLWEPGPVLYMRKGDAYVGIDMRLANFDTKTVGPQLAKTALARL